MILKKREQLPLDQYEAQRVCLIKPSAFGDIVQTLPVLTAIRQRFPNAQLSWLVNRSYQSLLHGHPDLDEIICFERHLKGRKWWSHVHKLAQTLKSRQFDLVCDLQGLLRSGLMSHFSGAARRIGLSGSREGARFFYTDIIPVPRSNISAVDRYWLLAQALGAGNCPKIFRLGLSEDDLVWAKTQLPASTRPILVIHPGARWQTKRWPPKQFAAIANLARQRFNAAIVIVGGPEEQPIQSDLTTMIEGSVTPLAGHTNFKQLAAILSAADLVLTGDSGPMHLAAAMNTPVISLFTCTDPVKARPYGPGHHVITTKISCAASYLKTCSHLSCMTELSVARVWPVVESALQAHCTQT